MLRWLSIPLVRFLMKSRTLIGAGCNRPFDFQSDSAPRRDHLNGSVGKVQYGEFAKILLSSDIAEARGILGYLASPDIEGPTTNLYPCFKSTILLAIADTNKTTCWVLFLAVSAIFATATQAKIFTTVIKTVVVPMVHLHACGCRQYQAMHKLSTAPAAVPIRPLRVKIRPRTPHSEFMPGISGYQVVICIIHQRETPTGKVNFTHCHAAFFMATGTEGGYTPPSARATLQASRPSSEEVPSMRSIEIVAIDENTVALEVDTLTAMNSWLEFRAVTPAEKTIRLRIAGQALQVFAQMGAMLKTQYPQIAGLQ